MANKNENPENPVVKPAKSEVKKEYQVKGTPVSCDGKKYLPGEKIALTEKDAAGLLGIGVLEKIA